MLEEALEGYDGTVILISHDRAFLAATATRVWSWAGGKFEDYPGGFDDWHDWNARRHAEAASSIASKPSPDRSAASPSASAPKPSGLSKNEQRRREAELQRLEQRIEALEAQIADVEARLADPALYAPGADPALPRDLTARRDALQSELADAYAGWEKVGEELAGV